MDVSAQMSRDVMDDIERRLSWMKVAFKDEGISNLHGCNKFDEPVEFVPYKASL